MTSYLDLGEKFYEHIEISAPKANLICFNHELAKELNLSGFDDDTKIVDVFSGSKSPDGFFSIASVYAGHQFGSFNPKLGDGRASLIFEAKTKEGEIFDIQLKGSGVTPFSRRGDGKSPLGPVIREYLVSEAMYALGVPTTRALCALSTDETIYREEALQGGIFTRVAKSHVRIGTFEYFASTGDKEALKSLFTFSVKRHYPNLDSSPTPDNVLAFLDAYALKQANLVATWMSLGFIHGVMNTDNMAISGETIDYGPCAFMDYFKRDEVFSFIDKNGRYRYSNQIEIAKWNFLRLCEGLLMLVSDDIKEAAKTVNGLLEPIFRRYETIYKEKMLLKLGIQNSKKIDEDFLLVEEFLSILESENLDFTNSFKSLESIEERKFISSSPVYSDWLINWEKRTDNTSKESLELMSKVNPVLIPRNHLVEDAIDQAYKGNFEPFNKLLEASKDPYSTLHNETSPELLTPPTKDEEVPYTFCGT